MLISKTSLKYSTEQFCVLTELSKTNRRKTFYYLEENNRTMLSNLKAIK